MEAMHIKNWGELIHDYETEYEINFWLVIQDPDVDRIYKNGNLIHVCEKLSKNNYKGLNEQIIKFGEIVLYYFARNKLDDLKSNL